MRYKYVLAAFIISILLNACTSKTNQQPNNTIQPESNSLSDTQKSQVQNNGSDNTGEKITQSSTTSDAFQPNSASGIPSTAKNSSKDTVNSSNKTNVQQKPSTTSTVKPADNKNVSTIPPSGPEDGSMQNQMPGLSGEVESISDNKITIKLIEMPQRPPSLPQGQEGQADQGTPPQRTFTYTGETKTITVTSDIPITTMNRTEQGMETVNLKFEDIKAGDILSVWYSDKETGKISKIIVQPKR